MMPCPLALPTHCPSLAPAPVYASCYCPQVEALNDVGLCLFAHCRPESLFCCAVLPEKGYVWLTKGAEAGSVLVYWVVDAAATPNIRWIRRNHLVFDLDETLIFNPPNIPRSLRNMDYVNPVPPHYISEPSDKAVLRPHVKEFLELVCPYFDQVRPCRPSSGGWKTCSDVFSPNTFFTLVSMYSECRDTLRRASRRLTCMPEPSTRC